MKFDADVIVVGAGPAGSRVAAKLAQAGNDVILLERRNTLGQPVCCTGIISTQCLAQFNISPDLVLREFRGAVINAPGGATLDISRPAVQAVSVDRSALDREMAETAVSFGAKLCLGAKVTGITNSKEKATVRFTRGGSSQTLQSRSVVIAAGYAPKLTGQLGLGKIRDVALGFQTEVTTHYSTGVELYLDRQISPGFFAWVAPVSETRAKVGLIARRRENSNLQLLVQTLQSKGQIAAETGEVQRRAIPLSCLPRTYADRVLVVGDSAGQVKPTTGGGLYYGLVCADIAFETLNSALALDDLSARSLKNYEQTWRALIGRDLLIGRIGRSLFRRIPERLLNHIILKSRDSGALDRLLEDESLTFDWHGKALLKATGAILASIF
jgi:digeranylgeranylglycerophospholipid reductase